MSITKWGISDSKNELDQAAVAVGCYDLIDLDNGKKP